jgi:membrane-bound serine protease (ClpP class)
MNLKILHILFSLLLICFFLPHHLHSAPPRILKIVINADINPAVAEYIVNNIERAEKEGFECLLIQMDTPGGLLESTKTIVKGILASDVPVIMYVAPSSSGAVSAGVFITMACHVAVMAEGTNIGAAHPVGIGGQQDTSQVMSEKVTNWASAWMRGIAEKHGRNADWAEQAVRRSVSINEQEALDKNVIDYICETETDLLKTVDGVTVELGSGRDYTLTTADAVVLENRMNWRYRILSKISNPNIAYILMILGIYGLFFELQNPGTLIPGIVGSIFLILAFFALQTLPVSWAGVLLILLSLIFFILEVKVASFGLLTIGGVVAMFFGSLMLFEKTPAFPTGVDWRLALTVALFTGLFFLFALGMVLKTRLTKPTTGREGLIGSKGYAVTAIKPNREGDVRLKGEFWKATSNDEIKKGDKIEVTDVDGLILNVKKIYKS